jgi:hypothetical protein
LNNDRPHANDGNPRGAQSLRENRDDRSEPQIETPGQPDSIDTAQAPAAPAVDIVTHDVKEGVAPHVVRQTLVKGRDRPMLVITVNRLSDFVVRGIPQEVLDGQASLIESHEVSVYPADADGLKRGRVMQKRRCPSEEAALQLHEECVRQIERGDFR